MMIIRHVLRHGSAAALLVIAGCSSADDADVAIEPIEPILASAIEIDVDPSGTTADFGVATNIPVACAVIYGTDDSFGSIAVDNDMQGGAHLDHGPLLTGLTPDTEYRYVLQGSDAAGTIYRSGIRTFRTPPAVDTGLGPNVATAGTAAASSEFSDAFAAANAIDGDLGTEWSTAGDGDDAWIEIDLGETQQIAAVAFRTRQMTDGTAITETFTITIDDDQVFGPFAAGPDPVVLDDVTSGRIVRFDADTTTGGNTGAAEIEIFGN